MTQSRNQRAASRTSSRTYWLWKAREARIAARLVTDAADRMALLKMADIYERHADRSERRWFAPAMEPRSGAPRLA